jgi:hypothetical protein
MNRRYLTGALVGGLLLVMSSSVAVGQAERTGRPDCRASQLAMTIGPDISGGTGQNPFTLRLTNRAQRPCILHGYPTIAFTDEHGSIPFPISHRGDQMIKRRPPTRVLVRAGRSAFVVVNKYRCDLGDVRLARTLRLGLPGRTSPLLSLPALPAYRRITYCGTNSQSTVFTSPFVSSVRAALWQW